MKIKKLIVSSLFVGIAFGAPAAFAIDNARLAEHCDLAFHLNYTACQTSANNGLSSAGLPAMGLGETVAAYVARIGQPTKIDIVNAIAEYCGGEPTAVTPPTTPPTYVMGGGSDGHNCN